MSEDKLTSNEVPQKFADWLLAMGCHPENVPPVEKVAEICRGQYYLVWRSLMEKVEAKDIIRNKRLQVFCDDIKKCQKKKTFEADLNTVVPEELLQWNRHAQLKENVADAESRVAVEKENLRQLIEHSTSKLSHRNILRKNLDDAQRRTHLLLSLAEQLREKQANVMETKNIAESLCGHLEETDVENKLNKCIAALSRQAANMSSSSKCSSNVSTVTPTACSTVVSTSDHNDEEVISCIERCRGSALYKHLYERRAALCTAIPADNKDSTLHTNKVQSVLCHTAALQSFIALEAMKNRVHIDRTRNKLARTFIEMNNYLSTEACELLITRCELACSEALLSSLRVSRQQLANKSGAFATGAQPRAKPACSLHRVDQAIEAKRDELRRLITSVAVVERKTQNARERLLSLFNGFHDNGTQERNRFGGRSSLSQESVSNLRQFYEEKREKHRNKVELSMNLDISENCSYDLNDGSPKFINELKLYLNKFSLEKNRKLVLESGSKIWMFESINSSLHDIYSKWQIDDVTTSMLSPTLTLEANLHRLVEDVARKDEMEKKIQELYSVKISGKEIDITPSVEEEQRTLDKIKKRLNDNILNLQKTNKTLDIGMENLHFWSDNNMKKYICESRKINGIGYNSYEKAYLHSIQYL